MKVDNAHWNFKMMHFFDHILWGNFAILDDRIRAIQKANGNKSENEEYYFNWQVYL